MNFGRIIFHVNPLNGHYLYPPFFPIQGLKMKKGPFWALTTSAGKGMLEIYLFFYSGDIRELFLIKFCFENFFPG